MTPEIRANVVSAIKQAVIQAVKTTTDTVTKKVTKKMRLELTMHNLLQMEGSEADSAKELLKAATSGTHSIVDIVQRLKALETQIQERATQVGLKPNAILNRILNPNNNLNPILHPNPILNPLPLRRRRRARGFTKTLCRPSTND